jgi:hypothetical protein
LRQRLRQIYVAQRGKQEPEDLRLVGLDDRRKSVFGSTILYG